MANRFNFRAWDGERMWEDAQGHIDWYDYIVEPKYTLMQSTGLTDNNGVEIFEGDIVDDALDRGQLAVIDFDKIAARIVWYYANQPGVQGLDRIDHGIRETITCGRVIGNIHEHEHLLEV